MTEFSILIPTFNHGPLIQYALNSILDQTEAKWEVFVIGDGSPIITRNIVKSYMKKDKRIHFIEKTKSPRNGELYRDEVIRSYASGKYVTYLSDDDMYFPDHLSILKRGFRSGANFVSTLAVSIEKEDSLILSVDLKSTYYRDMLIRGENRIPLSNGSHTKKLYLKLPYGWRTTPKESYSDLYMWQQFLRGKKTKPITIFEPTVLHFGSASRKRWTEKKRMDELNHWYLRLKKDYLKLRWEFAKGLFRYPSEYEMAVARNLALQDSLNKIYDSKIGVCVRSYFLAKELFRGK